MSPVQHQQLLQQRLLRQLGIQKQQQLEEEQEECGVNILMSNEEYQNSIDDDYEYEGK